MVRALLKHVVYCTSFATVFADDHDLMELACLISLISLSKYTKDVAVFAIGITHKS